jgi:hypothetical protein
LIPTWRNSYKVFIWEWHRCWKVPNCPTTGFWGKEKCWEYPKTIKDSTCGTNRSLDILNGFNQMFPFDFHSIAK